jgi:hypothetical protein
MAGQARAPDLALQPDLTPQLPARRLGSRAGRGADQLSLHRFAPKHKPMNRNHHSDEFR